MYIRIPCNHKTRESRDFCHSRNSGWSKSHSPVFSTKPFRISRWCFWYSIDDSHVSISFRLVTVYQLPTLVRYICLMLEWGNSSEEVLHWSDLYKVSNLQEMSLNETFSSVNKFCSVSDRLRPSSIPSFMCVSWDWISVMRERELPPSSWSRMCLAINYVKVGISNRIYLKSLHWALAVDAVVSTLDTLCSSKTSFSFVSPYSKIADIIRPTLRENIT